MHGNQILNTNIRYYTPSRQAGNLTQEAFRNIWTEENHSNLYPSATANVKNVVYDRYIEDGSYLRCSDITLNYTLPKSWMKKIGFQNIGVFASVKMHLSSLITVDTIRKSIRLLLMDYARALI